MYEAVKRVRDWREFGYETLGHSPSTRDKLVAIHRQHESDKEACLKAVIEAFLRGEGVLQPSWRRVIGSLYKAGENHIAHDIIAYAEPVQGECVLYDCCFQTNRHSAKLTPHLLIPFLHPSLAYFVVPDLSTSLNLH